MRARLYMGRRRGRSDWLSIRKSSRQSTGIGWVLPCKARKPQQLVTVEDIQIIRLTAIMLHLGAGRMRHTETTHSHPSESRQ